MSRLFNKDKRQRLIYISILVWFIFAAVAFIQDSFVGWAGLAVYFGSFTLKAGAYIWGEGQRGSSKSGWLKSKRERIVYIMMAIWIVTGIWGIMDAQDMAQLATYYVSLSGFISMYVIMETTKEQATDPTQAPFGEA